MGVGEEIKKARLKKKLSQRQLARKIGKTGQFISLIEKGENNPSLETLITIAVALDVSIEELISTPEATKEVIEKWDNDIDTFKLQEDAKIFEYLEKASTQQLIDELNNRNDFPIEIKLKK